MGIVGTGFSMSLDGFIADPHGDVGGLFAWYDAGDATYTYPGGMVVKPSAVSAQVIRETVERTGAIVTGRRLFDLTNGWGGRHPIDVPIFVVTHEAPLDWDHPDAPFTFVTDGVESAIAQARATAGEKNVGIGGANVAQQALRAGLVDEIAVELVPLLLGDGIRFFDHLGSVPIALDRTSLIEAPGVTHLRFRVVKQGNG
ncbi:MAG TPA: dihydrofolate reductase family protein [Thermomicrobiales bacterium]|jgi:dihydrofolate reductase